MRPLNAGNSGKEESLHILEREGCPLHAWISGPAQAPWVIFTHGAGADHRMFDSQQARLADRYRLLRWDIRGHGESRPLGAAYTLNRALDDFLALMDDLQISEAVLVGQSMGGNFSQELVYRHPERVKAFAVIGSTCNTAPLSGYERLLLRISPALLGMYPYEMLRKQSAQISALRTEVRAYIYDAMGALTKAEFVGVMTELIHCLHPAPDYRLPCPLLLTHGDQDGTGNIRKAAAWWADHEPRARYIVIPQAGHAANMDNPDFFDACLVEFLAAVLDQ